MCPASASSSQPFPGWLDDAPAAAGGADPYSDRIRPPDETVRRLQPFLPEIGITRLAQVTHLDRIGIPVWMAVRPNAATLSVSQGKGVTDDAARASALMEATELSVAESPNPAAIAASRASLEGQGRTVVDTRRLLRRGARDHAPDREIRWLEGLDLISREPVLVPEEIVGFASLLEGGDAGSPYRRSTDGLASGNIFLEAVLHGLWERIERDAVALWAYRPDHDIAGCMIDPAGFADPVVTEFAARVDDAGLRLALYDVTSDIGVPTFFAVIAPRAAPRDLTHMEVASGSGCHPIAVRAALRAVTEAAQSRLTTISGARDDFAPDEYRRALPRDLAIYLDPDATPTMAARPGYEGISGLSNLLGWTVARLEAARSGPVIVVPVGGEDFSIAVARIVAPELEDHPGDPDRRPGRRAVRAMMRGR